MEAQTPELGRQCDYRKGKLPSCAPLANPYVPFQCDTGDPYGAGLGLSKGTMFPGLNLPFMGEENVEQKNGSLLHKLQATSFAVTELGLYLDTHRTDTEALELFNGYKELYEELMAEYENKHGPLTILQSGNHGTYDWPEGPWPWDYKGKGEE